MSSATQGPLPSPILISACLDGVVAALSARPGLTETERVNQARAVMTLILSFMPLDAMQIMLAGQAVLFNALTADAGGDILRGMDEPLKPRARTNAVKMGALTAKHLNSLMRLQGRELKPAIASTAGEKRPASDAKPASPAGTRPPGTANAPAPAPVARAAAVESRDRPSMGEAVTPATGGRAAQTPARVPPQIAPGRQVESSAPPRATPGATQIAPSIATSAFTPAAPVAATIAQPEAIQPVNQIPVQSANHVPSAPRPRLE